VITHVIPHRRSRWGWGGERGWRGEGAWALEGGTIRTDPCALDGLARAGAALSVVTAWEHTNAHFLSVPVVPFRTHSTCSLGTIRRTKFAGWSRHLNCRLVGQTAARRTATTGGVCAKTGTADRKAEGNQRGYLPARRVSPLTGLIRRITPCPQAHNFRQFLDNIKFHKKTHANLVPLNFVLCGPSRLSTARRGLIGSRWVGPHSI
jgi:hypothetical protein